MRPLTLALAAAVLAAAAACGDSPVAPVNIARYSQADLSVGTGAEAVNGSTVTVHYTGWLYNEAREDQKGAIFDTSAGRDPFTFVLGEGKVIAGWDRGVAGMKVGGTRRLIIPPSLGYGDTRRGPIPPWATMVFDIELLGVQ